MRKILLIIGGKSTGLEIREVVDMYYKDEFDEVYNLVEDDNDSCPYSSIQDKNINSFHNDEIELYYITSMSNLKLRSFYVNYLKTKGAIPFNVIHPNSMIAKSAKLGKNIYIAFGTIISSFACIGDNSIVNYNVIIGHDTLIKKNCVLNPGSKVGGNVVVNENCLIGGNTFIKQGIVIGANSFIDAMCYINKDIQPSKIVKSNNSIKEYKNIFLGG